MVLVAMIAGRSGAIGAITLMSSYSVVVRVRAVGSAAAGVAVDLLLLSKRNGHRGGGPGAGSVVPRDPIGLWCGGGGGRCAGKVQCIDRSLYGWWCCCCCCCLGLCGRTAGLPCCSFLRALLVLVEVVLLEVVRPGETLPAARVLAHEGLGVCIVGSLVASKVRDPGEPPFAAWMTARVWLFACSRPNGYNEQSEPCYMIVSQALTFSYSTRERLIIARTSTNKRQKGTTWAFARRSQNQWPSLPDHCSDMLLSVLRVFWHGCIFGDIVGPHVNLPCQPSYRASELPRFRATAQPLEHGVE